MTPLLSVQHLKKYYATQKAVDDISLDIPQGSIFGLLGPNGAGKSTLLRMITGIFYPDSGTILMNGHPLTQKHTDQMGYMPEERGLYKKMKVGEHVLYLAQLKGLSKQEATQRCKEWFDKLSMQSWWHKKVSDLSKGMSQKLQFVATVVHQPRLLILDEPFSGLDPVNADVLKEEIFRLSQAGTTIIFSTHRMEQVETFCDRIALINKGKKILDGAVQDIQQQFKKHVFKIGLSDPQQPLPEGIEAIERGAAYLTFHLLDGQTTNRVMEYYINRGNTILSFNEILPTIHEIFISLVQETPDARVFES